METIVRIDGFDADGEEKFRLSIEDDPDHDTVPCGLRVTSDFDGTSFLLDRHALAEAIEYLEEENAEMLCEDCKGGGENE